MPANSGAKSLKDLLFSQVGQPDVKGDAPSIPEVKYETAATTYLHPKIDLSDIQDNGKVLSDAEIQKLKTEFKNTDATVVESKDYECLQEGGKLYAIYKPKDKDKTLGQGAYGSLHLMQNLQDGSWHVLKKQKIKNKYHARDIQAENNALKENKKLQFNINLKGKASNWAYTAIKLGKGVELRRGVVINHYRQYPEVRWIDMSISMLESVQDLHRSGFLHCDIKPENMLYNPASHTIEQVDYGFASFYGENTEVKEHRIKGTPGFMAPELNQAWETKSQLVTYNEATEVYALGISLMRMLHLYDTYNPDKLAMVRPDNCRVSAENYGLVLGKLNERNRIEYDPKVTPKHFEKIIASLKKDMKRLRNKYEFAGVDDKRFSEINKAISYLNDKNAGPEGLKYDDVNKLLSNLQKLLVNERSKMQKYGIATSTSQQKVGRLKKEVKSMQKGSMGRKF